MTPFRAWLAMDLDWQPVKYSGNYDLFNIDSGASPDRAKYQPVLIVPDTEENRRKLGMEE